MGRMSRHGIDYDVFDGRRRWYAAKGQQLPQTKLLDLDVIAIRSAARQRESLRAHIRNTLSNEALAKQFGVHIRTIEKVLHRETHTDVL